MYHSFTHIDDLNKYYFVGKIFHYVCCITYSTVVLFLSVYRTPCTFLLEFVLFSLPSSLLHCVLHHTLKLFFCTSLFSHPLHPFPLLPTLLPKLWRLCFLLPVSALVFPRAYAAFSAILTVLTTAYSSDSTSRVCGFFPTLASTSPT